MRPKAIGPKKVNFPLQKNPLSLATIKDLDYKLLVDTMLILAGEHFGCVIFLARWNSCYAGDNFGAIPFFLF